MNDVPDLFDQPPARPTARRDSKGRELPACALEADRLAEAFLEFHEENLHIYDSIVDLCRLAISKQRYHWGIKAILEVIRWNRAISTTGDVFKINNNHAAFYARMVMLNNPELDGFFHTRERGSRS